MDNLPRQSPRLNLTTEQQAILAAHIDDAVATLLQVNFADPATWNARIVEFVYAQGRIQMGMALKNYDAELAAQVTAESGEE